MTARQKFTIGQRVQLTADGRQLFLRNRPYRRGGVVVGFSPLSTRPRIVMVQRDGNRSVQPFDLTYWEAEETP